MALNPVTSGLGKPLRRLVYDNKSAGKVQLSIAPGDELVVSDDVAAQLEAAAPGSFKDADSYTPPGEAPVDPSGDPGLTPEGSPGEVARVDVPKPVKSTTGRSRARKAAGHGES